MGPSDAITYGLLAAPVISGVIGLLYLPFYLAEKREERKAVTPAQREALITERLVEGYRREGHSDPRRAAHEHKSNLYHIERFRLYACQQYVAGRSIDDIRKDWWKREKASIEHSMAIGADKAAGLRCAAVIRESIMEMPESEIFAHHPDAAVKWKKAKRELDAEVAEILKNYERDAVHDSVIHTMWENRAHPRRLMG